MTTRMRETADQITELIARPEPLRWLFAGDSITHGALHTMGWRNYVELFTERVRWEMRRMRDCLINTACSGWRIEHLRDDLEWSLLQHRPQIISINLGMNDCTLVTGNVRHFARVHELRVENWLKD